MCVYFGSSPATGALFLRCSRQHVPSRQDTRRAEELAAELVARGALKAVAVREAGGVRHAGYWCQHCSAHCSSAIAWKQHMSSQVHRKGERLNPWQRTMCLAEFPMRQGGTLEVNTKYHDLAQEQQRLPGGN